MSDACAGGCACGAIRYGIPGEPPARVDCQRQRHRARSYPPPYDRAGMKFAGAAVRRQIAANNRKPKPHALQSRQPP